jgi:hypothetical protein
MPCRGNFFALVSANELPYGGPRMNKYPGEPLFQQTAKANRQRLARAEREAVLQEIAKQEIAVRENMARLRELRLAKEAQEVGTEISTDNQAAKAKPKRRFQMGPSEETIQIGPSNVRFSPVSRHRCSGPLLSAIGQFQIRAPRDRRAMSPFFDRLRR